MEYIEQMDLAKTQAARVINTMQSDSGKSKPTTGKRASPDNDNTNQDESSWKTVPKVVKGGVSRELTDNFSR